MPYRTDKCRAYLTREQLSTFAQYAGVCRLIYNLALEQRDSWWRHIKAATGSHVSYLTQAKELTALRSEFDFIREVSQDAEQRSLMDLDAAFKNFFAGRAGYPKRKRKGVNDSFSFPGRSCHIRRVNAKWSMIKLPKIDWVKLRTPRQRAGIAAIREVTCIRDSLGWHVCLVYDVRDVPAVEHRASSVGIDRGVKNNIATSDGEVFSLDLSREEEAHRSAQRVIARRTRGSKRHMKAKARAQRIAARAARKRKHFNHVHSTRLTRSNRMIVIEDLNVHGMMRSARGTMESPGTNVTAKSRLNHAIGNAAWGQFESMLSYKCVERGVELIKVPPAYTSQTCSCCGYRDKANRESQARFACLSCGYESHADTNAAVNILRAGAQPAVSHTAKRKKPKGFPKTMSAEAWRMLS